MHLDESMGSQVRDLLRDERRARRITDPLASYSSSGKLSCQACRLSIPSDQLWDLHVKSKEHRVCLQRYREQVSTRTADIKEHSTTSAISEAASLEQQTSAESSTLADRTSGGGGRKRKATADEDAEPEDRKKAKPAAALPSDFFDSGSQSTTAVPSKVPTIQPSTKLTSASAPASNAKAVVAGDEVDEAEWEAFQRDIAATDADADADTNDDAPTAAATIAAQATITVAPVSAATLKAEQERQDAQARQDQRQRREAQAEGDREDAQRAVEEEMDEMVRLEDRVRRLRERREALRTGSAGQPRPTDQDPAEGQSLDRKSPSGDQPSDHHLANGQATKEIDSATPLQNGTEPAGQDDDDEEQSDDDDDDYDDWGRR